MAHRLWDRLWAYKREQVQLAGRFLPQGTSDPLIREETPAGSVTVTSQVFTVVRSGVGTFVVTFRDSMGALISGLTVFEVGSGLSWTTQLGAYDPVARTLVLRIIDAAGTPQDLTGGRVSFECWFSRAV